MLVLSRKIGETIHIEGVVVTVVAVRGDRVRIGITAPKESIVLRGELVVAAAQTEGKNIDGSPIDL